MFGSNDTGFAADELEIVPFSCDSSPPLENSDPAIPPMSPNGEDWLFVPPIAVEDGKGLDLFVSAPTFPSWEENGFGALADSGG